MISIEPIMDFDLDTFVCWIKNIKPSFVSIGADSKKSGLPEPTSEKIHQLIEKLSDFTEVKVKANLKRLLTDDLETGGTKNERAQPGNDA